MKQKLLAQLITKYPGVSKKFLGFWADKLLPKVTEESQIEGVVDELQNLPVSITDLAAEYQSEGDRRVTEAKKENPPKPDPGKTDDPKPDPKPDDTPAWAKALIQDVQALKVERVQGGMKAKAAEQLKGIPASYYAKRALPEKEEDLAAFVQEVTDDYNAFRQEMIDGGLMTNTPPAGGKDTKSTAVDNDIVAFAKKQSESVKAKN